MSSNAILRMCCPDQTGIVAQISNFIRHNEGNIVDLDQHVDTVANVFFARIEWQLEGFIIPRESLQSAVDNLIRPYSCTQAELDFTDVKPRLAILVTKESHCMYDLLVRHQSGELDVEIPLIISNHDTLKPDAEKFGIDFHHLPIGKGKDAKAKQEKEILQLLKEHEIDTVVLARYMQILTDEFVDALDVPAINIHHSFLPAFIGAKPYHQAHERGVKIIGATSHYVTADLDEGPIIAQDIMRVSHKDTVQDFIRRGRDLEKIVLARAVWQHVRRRILTFENKTVVF